jgi:integrase
MLHARQDGGLGLTLKQAQERLGHATLAMTADSYGHLIPVEDDGVALAAAERHLFAVR